MIQGGTLLTITAELLSSAIEGNHSDRWKILTQLDEKGTNSGVFGALQVRFTRKLIPRYQGKLQAQSDEDYDLFVEFVDYLVESESFWKGLSDIPPEKIAAIVISGRSVANKFSDYADKKIRAMDGVEFQSDSISPDDSESEFNISDQKVFEDYLAEDAESKDAFSASESVPVSTLILDEIQKRFTGVGAKIAVCRWYGYLEISLDDPVLPEFGFSQEQIETLERIRGEISSAENLEQGKKQTHLQYLIIKQKNQAKLYRKYQNQQITELELLDKSEEIEKLFSVRRSALTKNTVSSVLLKKNTIEKILPDADDVQRHINTADRKIKARIQTFYSESLETKYDEPSA